MATSASSVPMEYRYMGKSGLRLSVLSLGAWVNWGSIISDDVAFETMKTAFDMGCNFFDNAEVYAGGKAEETMGRCLKKLNVPRSELVISTKIFWGGKGVNERGLSRKHIIEGTNASLKRLDLEYVDIMFAHRPDPKTPIEETLRAFNYLIDDGKCFYWGTSEWSAREIAEACRIAEKKDLIPPVVEQPQYNMFHRTRFEAEYDTLYKDHGIGTTIWSPLASGLLSGKYNFQEKGKFETDTRLGGDTQTSKWLRDGLLEGQGLNNLEEKNLESVQKKLTHLKEIADKLGCSLAQLALAWTVKNPNVTTTITGASKVTQVVENFKSLEVAKQLTPDLMEMIEKILANKPASARDFRA